MVAAAKRCRVLLVDDEPAVVRVLEAVLTRQCATLEIEVATSAREALERLEHDPFDVIVSDLAMPEADGGALLEIVRQRYPGCVRLIYSGETLDRRSLEAVGVSQQFLGKQHGPRGLLGALRQICEMRELLHEPRLQALVGRIGALPGLPELYRRVVAELDSEDPSLKRIGQIIERDVAMTAKILQIVNSALFGLRTYVCDAAQAVAILGLDTIKTLVLSLEVFAAFDSDLMRSVGIDALWRHSLATAMLAKRIAESEGCSRSIAEQCFLAGMLHDVGKLVFWANLPREYLRVRRQANDDGVALAEAERRRLGASHGQVGAYLLATWGFPASVVDAVAWHDSPLRSHNDVGFGELTAVHVASAIERAVAIGASQGSVEACAGDTLLESVGERVDMAYLERLALDHRLPAWIDLVDREDCDYSSSQR